MTSCYSYPKHFYNVSYNFNLQFYNFNKHFYNFKLQCNLYGTGKELDIIKKKLRKDFKIVSDWFFENYMSLNTSKCHCMYLGKNNENDTVKFENISPINGEEEVILGLTIELLVINSFLIIM